MRMRDALGPIYTDGDFAALFPRRGQPAESPACLALVTIMQFAEGLPDRQAADAVRSRIDWKYALGLELTDPGFDASVLSEFRSRLLRGDPTQVLFERMLEQVRAHNLLKERGRARTDSTHILAAIRTLNRLECVGETLRHALNILATVAPAWLQSWVPSVWFDRYSRRFEEYRLPPGKAERSALAAQIGADGTTLLTAIYAPDAPDWLRRIAAVDTLRQVWVQQFIVRVDTLEWRTADELPPSALLIRSPYDVDARYSKKRQTEWTGYKVHLTETCEEDLPSLITNVETTDATTTDYAMTPVIQAHLTQRDLAPGEHLVDTGYMRADHLVTSRAQGIDLVGPVTLEKSWQAQADEARRSSLTGRPSRPAVPKVISAGSGRCVAGRGSPYSTSGFLGRPVARAPSERTARSRPPYPAPSPSILNPCTRRSRRPGTANRRRSSGSSMAAGRGWKAPWPKATPARTCATLGILGWPRPISSISAPPWA